jgi:hypothetical protein
VRRRDGQASDWRIPPETLQAAIGLLDGVACFVDHSEWFSQPSVRDIAGVTFNPFYNNQAGRIDGGLRLYDRPDLDWLRALLDQVVEDQQEGREVPDLGLSLSFFGRHEYADPSAGSGQVGGDVGGEAQDRELERVTVEITHVESCDLVFGPGADGRVREILSSVGGSWVREPGPGGAQIGIGGDAPEEVVSMTEEVVNQVAEGQGSEGAGEQVAAPVVAPEPQAVPEMPDPSAGSGQSLGSLTAQVGEMGQQIKHLTDLLADKAEDKAVQGMGVAPRQRVSVGPGSLEQVNLAVEAMIAGVSPPAGVSPLTGIRELYHLLSGDYAMTGMFDAEHVYLANVTSATMAALVANALNKVVVNEFQTYPRWWDKIVMEQSFTNLNDARWTTLGGVGELPTVAEGAAYTELTWDDKVETDSFVKKGGYLGLTLEAIDKDDTGRLRAAPGALAQAAWLTLSKSISALFTDNSGIGPTLDDTGALFNATAVSSAGGHANLGTTALSWASWRDTRVLMMKVAELNSGERMGALTAAYYCLVPIDLEATAIQALGSANEPGTADNDVNPYGEGDTRTALLTSARERVIVVPLWTDTNNWAAMADPRLYPSIGLGYRYGSTPEVFSVASPTAGLMFTNDTMPVKVRFFYVVGAMDYRGLYKHNVA